jgi:hypothetical protein
MTLQELITQLEFLVSEEEPDNEAIADLLQQIASKFDNAVEAIEELKGRAQAAKELADKATARRKALENAQERIKNYLIWAGNINPLVLQGEVFKGSIYTKESVEVDKEALDVLPETLKRVKTIVEPDKKAIKERLLSGEEIPGAKLIVKQHLRIS